MSGIMGRRDTSRTTDGGPALLLVKVLAEDRPYQQIRNGRIVRQTAEQIADIFKRIVHPQPLLHGFPADLGPCSEDTSRERRSHQSAADDR